MSEDLELIDILLYYKGDVEHVCMPFASKDDAEFIKANELVLSVEQLSTNRIAVYLGKDEQDEVVLIQRDGEEPPEAVVRVVQLYKDTNM